jgi:hypothetical protein
MIRHLSSDAAYRLCVLKNLAVDRARRELEAYVERYPGTPPPKRHKPAPEDYPSGHVASMWTDDGRLVFLTRAEAAFLQAAREEIAEWAMLYLRGIRTIPPRPESGSVAYRLQMSYLRETIGAKLRSPRSRDEAGPLFELGNRLAESLGTTLADACGIGRRRRQRPRKEVAAHVPGVHVPATAH